MEDLSFVFKNAQFEFSGVKFSVMLHGFINAYSLDPDCVESVCDGDTLTIQCSGLLCRGGQEPVAGHATIVAKKLEKAVTLDIEAIVGNAAEEIRCAKLSIHNAPRGRVINLIDSRPREIPPQGMVLRYPEGWRDVGTPLLILDCEDGLHYYRSHDTRVQEKRFSFVNRQDGSLDTELIFEPAATEMARFITVPTWELGMGDSVEEIYAPHIAHIEKAYNLPVWEEREDVPDWARKISLVASIHCMHWTGYIFNTYDQVLEHLKQLAAMIEPERILAYLPGWEGRYYYQYGDYRPEPLLGGAEGFKRLCDGAKELGIHVMPMFGINYASIHHAGYEAWGKPSKFMGPTSHDGLTYTDFDASRHYDIGYHRNLNPAAPRWQNRLVNQTHALIDQFGFEGAFYDISAVWVNDSSHELYPGTIELVRRIREGHPELLIGGEGWYDGTMVPFPLIQAGHTDGRMNYHDAAYAPILDKYARGFGHLCLGDPSRLSCGVHELGHNPEWRTPLRKGCIPTVTIVDGTMEKALDRVQMIVDDAKEYARLYL
ncbi:MAG: hypothetical protein J6L88_03530 [Clostridia bacterium]|nr:hypothetical protein [Clostridia bacterium]